MEKIIVIYNLDLLEFGSQYHSNIAKNKKNKNNPLPCLDLGFVEGFTLHYPLKFTSILNHSPLCISIH